LPLSVGLAGFGEISATRSRTDYLRLPPPGFELLLLPVRLHLSVDSPPETRSDTSTGVKLPTTICALFAVSGLVGCGSSAGTGFAGLSAAAVAGNWQIQTSTSSPSASPQGVVLLGALQGSSDQVSGTFRLTNLAQPDSCGANEVVTLTGGVDAKNTLTLTSGTLPDGTAIKVSLKIVGAQPYSGLGTIEVDGGACAMASASAMGSQIASTSGTFTGTLSPLVNGTPASASPGTATMTLTQSATPGSNGEFTTAGSLSYQFGSCSGKLPLNGSVSGVAMNFWDVVYSSGATQQVNLSGTTNVSATEIQAGSLSISPAPCSTDPNSSAVFVGKLNRQ
jgi:hypothetical protein